MKVKPIPTELELLKIYKAHWFLKTKRKLIQQDILKKINKGCLPDDIISLTTLNNHFTGIDWSSTGVSRQIAWFIRTKLDELLERDYQYAWDDELKDYVSIEKKNLNKYNDKLNGLVGTWHAYSWDAEKSTKEKTGHIHVFKMKIENTNKIFCKTGLTTFDEKEGRMYLIGLERVCIEVSHSGRKAIFMLHLGSNQEKDIKVQPVFSLGYVDSGLNEVHSGKVIIKRAQAHQDYASIVCQSVLGKSLENILPGIENDLRDTQYIMKF